MVGFTGRKFKRGNGLPTYCSCYAETNHEFPRIRDIRAICGFLYVTVGVECRSLAGSGSFAGALVY